MRERRGALAAIAAAAVVALAAACRDEGGAAEAAAQIAGGDAARGRVAIRAYGCGTCHTIPGVRGADGLVGPPLAGVAARVYLGGVLPNSPDNMVRWIRSPHAVDSLTAMPDLGVSASDARDIATYLYTLR
jgi:cytochrome c2